MIKSAFLSPKKREKVPAVIFQLAIIFILIFVGWQIVLNVQSNLSRLGISAGLGFLGNEAGFDISQKLIAKHCKSTETSLVLFVFQRIE